MSQLCEIGSFLERPVRSGWEPSVRQEQKVLPTPCFATGTVIKSRLGDKMVEDIEVGDEILTRDNGYQPVIWRGRRDLSADDIHQNPCLSPTRIAADALGPGLPERDLLVSPEHRMLLSSRQIQAWFGQPEVLIAAQHLTCYPGVDGLPPSRVSYVHIMFERHEVVLAEGCWTESFHFAEVANEDETGQDLRRELLALFPELIDMPHRPPARPIVTPEEVVYAMKYAAE